MSEQKQQTTTILKNKKSKKELSAKKKPSDGKKKNKNARDDAKKKPSDEKKKNKNARDDAKKFKKAKQIMKNNRNIGVFLDRISKKEEKGKCKKDKTVLRITGTPTLEQVLAVKKILKGKGIKRTKNKKHNDRPNGNKRERY